MRTTIETCFFCLAVFFGAAVNAQTEIRVALDHEDAMYKCGEQAVFTVTVMNGEQLHREGKASIRLSNDGLATFMTREVDLADENPFTVEDTMVAPGVLSLDVNVAAQPKALHKVFGAAFEPFLITPGAPAPEDFMQFWTGEKRKLERDDTEEHRAQSIVKLMPLPRLSNDKVEGFKVSFWNGTGTIYGFLTVPRAPGKFPALVSVPGAGPGATGASMLEDFVCLVMNVHKYDPDMPDKSLGESYKELNEGGMYMYKDIPDREKTYFHHGVLGIDRAVTWLASHEKVERECIGYYGSSQGGAFGLILGGLNPSICAVVCNVPAMCDQLGHRQGRLAGWPQFCRQMEYSPEIESMAQYYDAVNFAERIPSRVPVRIIVGLADRTCSPSSVFAAYNRIKSIDKKIICEVGMGHKTPPSYNTEVEWLKQYLKKRLKNIQKGKSILEHVKSSDGYGGTAGCVKKLKIFSFGVFLFAMDHGDVMPGEDSWQEDLAAYCGLEDCNCQDCGRPYHYVRQATGLSKIKDPVRTVMFYEDLENHDGVVNIAFADGHVSGYQVVGCKTIEELAAKYGLLLGDGE